MLVLSMAGGPLGPARCGRHAVALYFLRSVPVVISTLLLVYIAAQVVYLRRDPVLVASGARSHGRGVLAPQSDLIRERRWLPRIGEYPGLNFSSTVIIALVLVAAVNVMLKRSTWGFRLKMLGMNRLAARRAGVSAVAFGGTALMLSGAFAGVAGGALLTGGNHRLQPGISENVGWDGLLVALVARENPVLADPGRVLLRCPAGRRWLPRRHRRAALHRRRGDRACWCSPPSSRPRSGCTSEQMRSRRNARALAASRSCGMIETTALILASTLRLATPLAFAACGEYIAERAGMINISIEAMMLSGAFSADLGATRDRVAGPRSGVRHAGGLVIGVHARELQPPAEVNTYVVGLTLNVLVLGLTSFLLDVRRPRPGPGLALRDPRSRGTCRSSATRCSTSAGPRTCCGSSSRRSGAWS